MKRKFSLLLIGIISLSIFGCSCNKKEKTVDIYMPDGAPALSLAKLMYDNYTIKGYNVQYHIVASETITSHITNGNADIAIVPTNAAANLYNKGNDIKIISSNTWGLLYMVGNADYTTPITDLNTLKGEVVGIIGQGQVPDLVFKYILEKNNIEYTIGDKAVAEKITIRYFADGPSMIPLLKQKKLKYGILGEPAVSSSIVNASTSIILDIQSYWKEASETTSSYPQASLIVKTSFLNKNKDFISSFLDEVELSNTWILDHPEKLNATLKKYGSTSAMDYTREILLRCNINLVKGIQMKNSVFSFLESLYSLVPQSIGGKLPDDSFFYLEAK